jgi:hypothetical protein
MKTKRYLLIVGMALLVFEALGLCRLGFPASSPGHENPDEVLTLSAFTLRQCNPSIGPEQQDHDRLRCRLALHARAKVRAAVPEFTGLSGEDTEEL